MRRFVKPSDMAGNSMPSFIVDASVLLKWFLDEEGHKNEALLLKNDYAAGMVELNIPDYAYAEFLNTAGRVLPVYRAQLIFSLLLMMSIPECSVTLEVAGRAFRIMKKYHGVSFYDAGYHALAMEHNAVFITADKKYYAKAKKLGNILYLGDYGKKR